MTMSWQDYVRETRENALAYIHEECEYYSDWDAMRDALFLDDSVTGDASGSFTGNFAEAAENVGGVIFDENFNDALEELDYARVPIEDGPESLDVLARCCALYECIDECKAHYDALCALLDEE